MFIIIWAKVKPFLFYLFITSSNFGRQSFTDCVSLEFDELVTSLYFGKSYEGYENSWGGAEGLTE